jgi:hypothetical protein
MPDISSTFGKPKARLYITVIKQKNNTDTDLSKKRKDWNSFPRFNYRRNRTPSSDCIKKAELVYLIFEGPSAYLSDPI